MRCVRCGFESIQKAGPALNADVGSAMETEPYLPILRRVGIVLLLAGLIDIGVMVYCIANDISYSSSFNIFAVIGAYLKFCVGGHIIVDKGEMNDRQHQSLQAQAA